MAIIGSLLFGREGSYTVLGQQVTFEKLGDDTLVRAPYSDNENIRRIFSNCILGFIQTLVNSEAFNFLSFGRFHVFCHEMGHALSGRLLTGFNSSITVYTDYCGGRSSAYVGSGPVGNTISNLAGPLSGIFFSGCKLLVAAAYAPLLTTPIATFLAAGSLLWMTGELIFAFHNVAFGSYGDFHLIQLDGGNLALFLSLAALIGSYAFFLHTALLFLP